MFTNAFMYNIHKSHTEVVAISELSNFGHSLSTEFIAVQHSEQLLKAAVF